MSEQQRLSSGKAIVLLSGGLDSATVLAMATDQGYECHCLSFDYGQRHRTEIEFAAGLAAQFSATCCQTKPTATV